MKRMRPLLIALALLLAPAAAGAQLNISGQADVLALGGSDDRGLNRNFRGDSPFSPLRGKLFLQHWVNDRAGVFGEILFDMNAPVRINGLYMVLNEVAGQEWLSVRAGLAPSVVGSFGLRSTYFNSNPLIGVPLVWQHRTTLDGSGLATAADLLRRRRQNYIGLPMMYDACWNIQWEALGEVGKIEYSVGVTPGAVSNPGSATVTDGVQLLGRLGYIATESLRFGVSGVHGPYIGGPLYDTRTQATEFPGGPEDYDQQVLGFDAEYALGKFLFMSEGYLSSWEAPLVEEDLNSLSGYLETRYDVAPEWTAAFRAGAITFSDVTAGGETNGWDDDVLRLEGAVTYRIAREIQLRLGWQHSEFLTGPEEPIDLVAAQLRAVF